MRIPRWDLRVNGLLGGKPEQPNEWWPSTLICEVVLLWLAVAVVWSLVD